jgi:hypothetical protein
MVSYPDPPRPRNGIPRVCCSKCGRPSAGFFYCFKCRRKHAAGAKLYMRVRRQDETFCAAERIKTKLRMRRLRAALRRAELEARRVNSGSDNRRSRARRLEHQAPPP